MLCDHNHDVIYRAHLIKGILNVSFQPISCQEIGKQYVLTVAHA